MVSNLYINFQSILSKNTLCWSPYLRNKATVLMKRVTNKNRRSLAGLPAGPPKAHAQSPLNSTAQEDQGHPSPQQVHKRNSGFRFGNGWWCKHKDLSLISRRHAAGKTAQQLTQVPFPEPTSGDPQLTVTRVPGILWPL